MDKIIDFYICVDFYTPDELHVKFESGKDIVITCVDINKYSYDEILSDETLKQQALDTLNQIYVEHIKLKLAGTGFPVYEIIFDPDKENKLFYIIKFDCKESKLKTYIVKKFVNQIILDDNQVKELVLTAPVRLYNMGRQDNTVIRGLEYLEILYEKNLPLIDFTLRHTDGNKTLTLKHLKEIKLGDRFYSNEIEKIVLDGTCKIVNIPLELFNNLTKLKEVKLCKSVMQIGNELVIERVNDFNGSSCVLDLTDFYHDDKINNINKVISINTDNWS